MSSIKNQVLLTIRSNNGLSLPELYNTLNLEDLSLINSTTEYLVAEGLVTYFQGKYFATVRRIVGYDKNQEELTEEIELPDLTANEVSSIMEPYQDDPLFYYCYELDIETAAYFIHRYNLDLNFKKNDYFLEACFDNTIEKEKNNS